MKYYLLTFLTMLALAAGSASCGTDDLPEGTHRPATPGNSGAENGPDEPDNDYPGEPDNDKENTDSMSNDLKITAGSALFHATLENNAAASAFKALLPLTINMSEMNGNEKYHYLSGNLPAASSRKRTIRNGDLMLYGSSCVVLFYKTFSTSYRYTPLGRVDDPAGLEAALGPGSVTITFELP